MSYLFFGIYILGKSVIYINWTFGLLFLFKFSPVNSHGSMLAFSQIVRNILLLMVPYYNQIMNHLEINPIGTYFFLFFFFAHNNFY